MYEIVIGGWGDSQSVIRQCNLGLLFEQTFYLLLLLKTLLLLQSPSCADQTS